MHELALLTSVVEAVARAAAGERVERVRLRVGARSGTVIEALEGSWPIATAGTPLDGASLSIEAIPAAVWCPGCVSEQQIDEFYALTCPRCGTPTGNLVRGREFEVAWAEIAVGHDAASMEPTTDRATRTASGTAPST